LVGHDSRQNFTRTRRGPRRRRHALAATLGFPIGALTGLVLNLRQWITLSTILARRARRHLAGGDYPPAYTLTSVSFFRASHNFLLRAGWRRHPSGPDVRIVGCCHRRW
jgi:hypothetical protein